MLKISNFTKCQRLIITQATLARLLIIRNLHKESLQVAWEKPEVGWTKLNFDGSCKGKTGRASIGGVCRNHKAEFLLGYAESIGRSTSTIAEMAALRRGLELVLENGWNHVWLEGDSKTLVEIIARRRRLVNCTEAQRHVDDINSMIMELKNCMVTHVYREGNRTADKFAQMGHQMEGLQIWRDQPPHQVRSVMDDDAEGKFFPRRR